MKKQYFHVCANGADARNFIICQADYFAAFNLVAVCAANTQVVVVSFSLEDSHPHFLLWGTEADCLRFKILYERLYSHHAAATRKGKSELVLRCELYPIGDDQDYLLNVAVYTVIQATKDGKAVMPERLLCVAMAVRCPGEHLPTGAFRLTERPRKKGVAPHPGTDHPR